MEITKIHQNLSRLKQAYQVLLDQESQDQTVQMEELRHQLEVLKHAYSQLPPKKEKLVTAPMIFSSFKLTYSENAISDYLAYILDPHLSQIGPDPLTALMKNVCKKEIELDPKSIRVEREYPLDERFLDLFIELDEDHILVIENKIFAPEGDNQTVVYYNLLKKHFPHHDLSCIFLTPDGRDAKSHHFEPLSYKQLVKLLRGIPRTWDDDPRKMVFWDDFLTHLEVYIVKDNGNYLLSERSRLYVENYTMINELVGAINEDWPQLIQFLKSAVVEMLSHQPGKWETLFNTSPSKGWHQVYQSGWITNSHNVHFEFYFTPSSFKDCVFQMGLDFEGSKDNFNRFRELFEETRSEFGPKFSEYGFAANQREWVMPYRDRYQLAWRQFSFTPDLSKIDQEIAGALKNYLFLAEPIGRAINAIHMKSK